jgi:ketosteroid isomerase-like protein
MEIKEFFTIYREAVWNKDAKAMTELYDKEAVIFDTWDQGYVESSSEWNKIIEDWFNSLGDEKVKVDFEMENIHQSDNVGFASAVIQFRAISGDGNVLRSMKNRINSRIFKI